MLTHISIENFKGIRDLVEIELKPITLLFGPNSAGKSTILHALLYAQEVFERHNLDADTTAAGGPFIDLGGFKNMVHGRDPNRAIRLGLRFDFEEGDWQDYKLDIEAFGNVLDCEPERLLARPKSAGVSVEICWSELGPFVQSCQLELDSVDFARIDVDRDSEAARLRLQKLDHPLLERFESESVGVKCLVAEESSGYTPGSPIPRTGSILHTALEAVGLGKGSLPLVPQEDALPRTESQLQFLERAPFKRRDTPNEAYLARKRRKIWSDSSGPRRAGGVRVRAGAGCTDWTEEDAWEEAEYRQRLVSDIKDFVNSTVMNILRCLRDRLRSFRYLGPVREIPRRNAAPPSSPDPARWSSGLGAWDRLQKCDTAFVSEVNDWLSDSGRLDTGVRLVRRELVWREESRDTPSESADEPRDLIRQEAATKLAGDMATERRISLVPKNGRICLSLHDLGIGVAQLLPVVVAALDRGVRLDAIEQPELHLHPAMQVILGDLLIAGIQADARAILVETHSEHLLLRLLRRIRETSDRELPPSHPGLRPQQLAVVFVENDSGRVRVTPLPIDETGEFETRWPRGFFEERVAEIF